MNQGGRPISSRSVGALAQALTVVCVGVFAFGGVAVAAPNGDPGPPPQAQGDGPPADKPAAQGKAAGKAKQHARKQANAQSGGDRHGKTGGGHAKARGNGHTGTQGQPGGQGQTHGRDHVRGRSGAGSTESHSNNGHAGKVTLCHATGSSTNPYVEITVSENAVHAHARHQDGRDIIPAPAGGCPGGSSEGGTTRAHGNEHGKVTLCHATGSETNPYVEITISANALPAHLRHQDGEDIYPVPAGGCPSTEIVAGLGNPPSGILSEGTTGLLGSPEPMAGDAPAGVMGVSEEGGTAPADEEGGTAPAGEEGSAPADVGGVLGANQGGGDEPATVRDTTGSSLPFTGLALGLLVGLGALLATTGLFLRRRTTT